MQRRLLGRYVDAADATSLVFDVPRPRWFGGYSHRWDGGVAYLGLAASPGGAPTQVRAFRMTFADVLTVAAGENVDDDALLAAPLAADLPPGGWVPLPVTANGDPLRGKYNALLRLDDVAGVPAMTLTTWREITPRPPGPDYATVILDGLIEAGVPPGPARSALESASARPTRVPPPTGPLRWRCRLERDAGCPPESLAIPRRFGEFLTRSATAQVSVDGPPVSVTLEPTETVASAARCRCHPLLLPGAVECSVALPIDVGARPEG